MNKDITLVIVDTINHNLAKFSIEQTLKAVPCKDILTFSNKEIISGARLVPIKRQIDLYDYSEIILKQLWTYVETEHVLITQWDGMAVNENLWTDEFLEYDYIGAIWPWPIQNQTMGNGGFSLRSRRLIEACRDPQVYLGDFAGQNEDIAICVEFRKFLMNEYQIKYAPENIARKFSVENEWLNQQAFGFHGIWNVPRFLDYSGTKFVIDNLPDYIWKDSTKYAQLLNNLDQQIYKDLVELILEKIKKEKDAHT